MTGSSNVNPIRLGTRGSALALWQANYIADRLRPIVTPRLVQLVHIETQGDQDQIRPLSQLGGFGVFTKAIQQAVLDGRVDVAVHSLKDLPTIPEPGLSLIATPPRAPVGDVWLSEKFGRFDELPVGATLATGSQRRRSQVLNRRPDLRLVEIRGNIDTRLRKLRDQGLDGLILAQAGLERLGLGDHIREVLDPSWMLPAVGQGAIGLECRADDVDTIHWIEALNDPMTWATTQAERAMLYALGGGCQIPVGAYTTIRDEVLTLRGAVLSPDGSRRIVDTLSGPIQNPRDIGHELAARLFAAGAREVMEC